MAQYPEYVGVEQYQRLLDALAFYDGAGFQVIDVPWAVSRQAMDITRPAWAGPATMMYTAGGQGLCPVASAEQSFLQMQLEARAGGKPIEGRFAAITPCFRNEPKLDSLHRAYFMKVELIQWVTPQNAFRKRADLDHMIALASRFFDAYLNVDIVENLDPDPIGHAARDIVSYRGRVELGSYGIRKHESVGEWIYGTGAAEPRLSFAIKQEEAPQEKTD
jgi:hypothetical protein